MATFADFVESEGTSKEPKIDLDRVAKKDPALAKTIRNIEAGVPPYPLKWNGGPLPGGVVDIYHPKQNASFADMVESADVTATSPKQEPIARREMTQAELEAPITTPLKSRRTQPAPAPATTSEPITLSRVGELAKGFLKSSAALADIGIAAPAGVVGEAAYALARPFTTPEGAAQVREYITKPTQNVIGRAAGITESPEYKGEIASRAMQFVAENVNKGATWISQRTGIPVSDVENMIGTLGMAAPAVIKPVAGAVKTTAQGLREGASLQAQMADQFAARRTQAQPGTPVSGGSVGAAGAQLRTQVEEVAARLPQDEAARILSLPPEKVDLDAANRRAVAHKFGIELTEGEAKQNASKLGDEFNAKKESPEIQRRLDERSGKLFQGLDTVKERSVPDIYTTDRTELGQMAIDHLQAKDAVRRAEITGLYKQLEDANAGQFPIDTGTLLTNIESELGKKMRSRYAPAELMDTIREASRNGAMTFEQYENLRTIAAEEIRSAKDGNRRYAAGVIRDQLENMPLSTDNAAIKQLADRARAAAKARFDLIDANPAYKAAVRDTRNANDIANGLESVGADKFLNRFLTGTTDTASIANVTRLIGELGDNTPAHQALKAGFIEHLRAQATHANGQFGQHKYNQSLSQMKRKMDRVFAGDLALQELRELGELASWTEHKRATSGANVSESGNVVVAAGRKALETAANVKTGGLYGKVQQYRANKERQTELRRMVEPGAGLSKD